MWDFFVDPVLRGPTIASMLMCGVAALAGVIAYLRKESLVGEALSHATYPGVIFGVVAAVALGLSKESSLISLSILGGAFITALLSFLMIRFLVNRMRVPSDAALCFVLSVFFGAGVLWASHVQFTHTSLYPQIQVYLYGQAATMTDFHIYLYLSLAIVFLVVIYLLYKELQVLSLDRNYAKSLGVKVHLIDSLLLFLIVLSIVIGIRSVGVVMMSAMLIAPAAAARQYTDRLSTMFLLAALIGVVSGFLGNYLSLFLSSCAEGWCGGIRIGLPTGPMIVLTASIICILSLLLAPERGVLFRMARILRFRSRCLKENILKTIWHYEADWVPASEIKDYLRCSTFSLSSTLIALRKAGWVEKKHDTYRLTPPGSARAARIVRLHRLWEVYLADYLGIGAEKVHHDAEQMEHIITPELEAELTELLKDPKVDPHHQPIPRKGALS